MFHCCGVCTGISAGYTVLDEMFQEIKLMCLSFALYHIHHTNIESTIKSNIRLFQRRRRPEHQGHLLQMKDMMRWIILVIILTHLTPSNPGPISLFSPSNSEVTSGKTRLHWSADLDGEQGQEKVVFDCDGESLTVEFSPNQHTNLYLLIDDKPLVSLRHLLQECSHVELQPTSLIRIYYTGCFLQDWVGRNTQYSLKLGFSIRTLNEDNITPETCPASTSGPHLPVPAVTCGSKDVIVKLPANELKYAQIIELDTPSLGERDTSKEPGLTQERAKDFLVITVIDPRMEDHVGLVLQYTDVTNELYTAKVFCTQYHTKPRSKRETEDLTSTSSLLSIITDLSVITNEPTSTVPTTSCSGTEISTTESETRTTSAATSAKMTSRLATAIGLSASNDETISTVHSPISCSVPTPSSPQDLFCSNFKCNNYYGSQNIYNYRCSNFCRTNNNKQHNYCKDNFSTWISYC
ncbi:uncharacterized protein LOC128617788 [Ictalurus furcatus]|uniref:uncharacterized protein LOC128617788 n=1 Tax=Ictalurus furcatus TaxID=66913 RepID=UPI002350F702|nr:uncharacterized protein LOC128617788 [Ictalurus furcatus]